MLSFAENCGRLQEDGACSETGEQCTPAAEQECALQYGQELAEGARDAYD